MKKFAIIMSVLAITSLTTAKGQTVNTLSDTGNVGLGTTSPATKLEVVGDTKLGGKLEIDSLVIVKDSVVINKKLTVDQDIKIKGESVFDGNGKFKSDLRVLGTARMKEKLVVDSTANFKDKIVVDGLGRFNGDIKLTGDFIFGNNKRISYLPASGGNPEIIGFGKGPNIGAGTPCTLPLINVPVVNQFWGMLQLLGYSDWNTTSGNLNSLNIGYDGSNGIIDMKGLHTDGSESALLINWYCGRDVNINTNPAKAGNVTMTSATMGMVGIGKTPSYKLDVAGNVSINNNSLFLKDENHGLSQANSLPNVNINGDGPFLYGWGGGALGINHAGTYTKVLSWNENGNVGIGTSSPNYKLDVGGNMSINSNILFFKDENHGLGYFQEYADKVIDGPVLFGWSGGSLATNQNGTTKNILTWNADGKVNINADASQTTKAAFTINDIVSEYDVFRVMSNGNVFATELTIKLKENFDFPDYVFAKDYQLMPLAELEHFITKNKHLPNIPNAKEVEKNGLNVSEIQIKQMQKIEELTLYILELNKRIEELERK